MRGRIRRSKASGIWEHGFEEAKRGRRTGPPRAARPATSSEPKCRQGAVLFTRVRKPGKFDGRSVHVGKGTSTGPYQIKRSQIRTLQSSTEREKKVSSDRQAADRAAEARAGGPRVGGRRAGASWRQVRRDVHPDELHVPVVQHEGQEQDPALLRPRGQHRRRGAGPHRAGSQHRQFAAGPDRGQRRGPRP
jgi:hypothetical protein